VLVSALTGFGLDTLRAETSALLASLWVDVDVDIPYSAGELLARVRERGTVELDYGERDVRVHGRIAPSLAGELEAVGAAWRRSLDEVGAPQREGEPVDGDDGPIDEPDVEPAVPTRRSA
jgi:hypothetical protein